ncbi:MAG: signal peptidase I, partial [Solobacterium sp.]|nr:signal peptidase I [Solobacterium sp.]
MDRKKEKSLLGEVIDILVTFGCTFLVVWLIVTYLFTPVRVLGQSMFPGLKDGDFGFTNTIARNTVGVQRGDIVIVYLDDQNTYLIKRLIGLPGDTVEMKDSVLYVNGEAVAEDYLDSEYAAQFGDAFFSDIEEVQLDQNEYYVLGDNRINSRDSRYYGPFSGEQIRAKAVFIVFPPADF